MRDNDAAPGPGTCAYRQMMHPILLPPPAAGQTEFPEISRKQGKSPTFRAADPPRESSEIAGKGPQPAERRDPRTRDSRLASHNSRFASHDPRASFRGSRPVAPGRCARRRVGGMRRQSERPLRLRRCPAVMPQPKSPEPRRPRQQNARHDNRRPNLSRLGPPRQHPRRHGRQKRERQHER